MEIAKNSRQMPSMKSIVKEKNYCDLLYAWVQCNSERIGPDLVGRRIAKDMIKWTSIEKDFTRVLLDGTVEKVMNRKTIAKYFDSLIQMKLIEYCEEDGYYYLTVLENGEASLIEYNTLMKMMNVFQKNSISIYIYLFNRYYANGCSPFIATIRQIKEYIGIATSTTSNNAIVDDTIEMLQKLGLLSYQVIRQDEKTMLQFKWVKNKLD